MEIATEPCQNLSIQTEGQLQPLAQDAMVDSVKGSGQIKRTRAATSPPSTASSRSESSTRRTAVSVEWPGRKPDYRNDRRFAKKVQQESITTNNKKYVLWNVYLPNAWCFQPYYPNKSLRSRPIYCEPKKHRMFLMYSLQNLTYCDKIWYILSWVNLSYRNVNVFCLT